MPTRRPFARALALLLLLAPAVAAAPAARHRLIAHRGGVVEGKFPDNSAAALQAAVARGYGMIEVDIRETKDGVLVMQHDPDLRLNFGDARRIFETPFAALKALRTTVAAQPLLTFDELVAAAKAAGLRLMLDSKNPHSPDFPRKVEAILARHGMVGSCYVIGTGDAMSHFLGKALVGFKYHSLRPRLEADPSLKEKVFLFDEGRTLTAEMVRWAQVQGVKVVPSINVYHYYDAATMAGKSRAELEQLILPRAKAHIDALKALGVTEFQIDSEFDGWF
ncbi:MAG: hypothetical protein JNL39_10140 [Opitutaceae bacterium]|nr:hypothetical protein [Opitutaceae bacterium]